MTLPLGLGTIALPDWLPWWAAALLMVVAVVYALLALLVPFSTFGLRGRLDAMEARLDDVQHEMRSLSMRMPGPMAEDYPPPRGRDRMLASDELPRAGRLARGPAARAEPRLGGRE